MPQQTRPVRAVLFDLDGTLIDNMHFHIDAWIETGQRLGRELTREQIMRDFAGRRNEDILPSVAGRALDAHELATLAQYKEARYRELYGPHLRLVPGAAALLAQLAACGIVCGIASAAPYENREFVLGGLGLRAQLATVVGIEDVTRGKPAPDLFLEAAKRLGCLPEDTLVFEDAYLGVQAGCAAGMRVCGITTAEPREVLLAAGAIATSQDFSQLPPEISALFAPTNT